MRGRRGVALVELAIVLSLLMMLVFGMIDFGLLLRDYISLSQVAREAARSAALGTDPGVVRSRIKDWAREVGIQSPDEVSSNAIIQIDPQPGGMATVTVTYSHKMTASRLLGIADTTQLRATMVMRRE